MGGFNLPPGVTTDMLEPDDFCPVCFQNVDDCICPQCPQCGERGDINCYGLHGLKLTKQQAIKRVEQKIADLKDQIADDGRYIEWLKDRPDDYQVEADFRGI